MADAKRPLRGDCDCGRGSQGLGIDLGRKFLVIHGRCRRERERSNEESSGEADRRFPFIGVAQDLTKPCLVAVFWGGIWMPACLQEKRWSQSPCMQTSHHRTKCCTGSCFYNGKGCRFKSRCPKVNSFLFCYRFAKTLLTAASAPRDRDRTCLIRGAETSAGRLSCPCAWP